MRIRHFAILPLLAATAIAQSDAFDTHAVALNKFIVAQSYGNSLDGAAMSLDLNLIAEGKNVTLVVTGGQPGKPVNLLIAQRRARVSLDFIGVDGHLLVDRVQLTATGVFDSDGTYKMKFELTDRMSRSMISVQAGSVRIEEGRADLALSNGISFVVKDI